MQYACCVNYLYIFVENNNKSVSVLEDNFLVCYNFEVTSDPDYLKGGKYVSRLKADKRTSKSLFQ